MLESFSSTNNNTSSSGLDENSASASLHSDYAYVNDDEANFALQSFKVYRRDYFTHIGISNEKKKKKVKLYNNESAENQKRMRVFL